MKQTKRAMPLHLLEVAGLLDGSLRQLWRPMNPQPPEWCDRFGFTCFTPPGCVSGRGNYEDQGPGEKFFRCPIVAPGQSINDSRVWVQETFMLDIAPYNRGGSLKVQPQTLFQDDLYYLADDGFDGAGESLGSGRWRASTQMPRWASRFTLQITSARVNGAQYITDAECLALGIKSFTKDDKLMKYWPCDPIDGPIKQAWRDLPRTPRDAYSVLWDFYYGKKFPWSSNPWSWVYEVEKVADGD